MEQESHEIFQLADIDCEEMTILSQREREGKGKEGGLAVHLENT